MAESMKTLYLICATIGGTILVVQTILLALGMGAEADADVDVGDIHDGGAGHGGFANGHDHDHTHASDSFLKLLSFKTVVAFVTFFGLAGLATHTGGWSPIPSLSVAVCAGGVALYLVAYLMTAIARLESKGNLNLQNAVGLRAKVYLRVPGENSGQGKVTVSVQGRRVECKAVTAGPEIPTGAEVQIVGTIASDTLDVVHTESRSRE